MLLPTWLLHKHTQTNKLHCLWSTVYTGQSRPPPPPSSLAVVLTSSSVFPLSHHASTLCLSNMVSLQKRSCVCQRSTRRKFRLVGTDETYLEHVDESFTHTHTHTLLFISSFHYSSIGSHTNAICRFLPFCSFLTSQPFRTKKGKSTSSVGYFRFGRKNYRSIINPDRLS